MNSVINVGSFAGGDEWSAGSTFEVHDPGRLSELVGIVATASASDVDSVVAIARRAQTSWAKVGVEERAALLQHAAAELERESENFAVLMTRENGSLLATSQEEIAGAATALRNAAELGDALLSEDETFADGDSWLRIERRPYGVVGCIVPWSAPVILTVQKIGPALVAGNSVIVKPSPFAPLAVSVLLRLFAGFFPPGIINVIHGDGGVGAALISHPGVRKVSFTVGL